LSADVPELRQNVLFQANRFSTEFGACHERVISMSQRIFGKNEIGLKRRIGVECAKQTISGVA
jgi:hypothetical protein